ncbi:MAG: NfeD family protein [Veillonellales bacterium]
MGILWDRTSRMAKGVNFMGYRIAVLLIISCLLLISPGYCAGGSPEPAPVIVVNIKGEIDSSQAALIYRAVKDAQSRKAQAIVVEIDTFGGLVDSAVKIRDLISESPVKTICYVKNRAWSAGALIAISHQHIAMAPGGSIGAAEPIPTTEKTVAALKAEFAATANKNRRNAKVAEAMVDKSLGYPGYAEPGQILALTDYQAVQLGYADLIAANRQELLAHYGLEASSVIEYSSAWQDKMAGWLSDPTMKAVLLTVIFLAVLVEIKTAGMGVAALIGLLAAFVFYAGQWLTGLAGWLELTLFIGGILLLVIELHTPGAGIFGAAGAGCILFSLYQTLGGDAAALTILAVSMLVAVIIFLFIVSRLPSNRLWAKVVLQDAENSQSGFSSSQDYSRFLEREGVTQSLLRPAGIVVIDGTQLDVVSEGQYIKAGVKVKVVSVSGSRIVVRPVKE